MNYFIVIDNTVLRILYTQMVPHTDSVVRIMWTLILKLINRTYLLSFLSDQKQSVKT